MPVTQSRKLTSLNAERATAACPVDDLAKGAPLQFASGQVPVLEHIQGDNHIDGFPEIDVMPKAACDDPEQSRDANA